MVHTGVIAINTSVKWPAGQAHRLLPAGTYKGTMASGALQVTSRKRNDRRHRCQAHCAGVEDRLPQAGRDADTRWWTEKSNSQDRSN